MEYEIKEGKLIIDIASINEDKNLEYERIKIKPNETKDFGLFPELSEEHIIDKNLYIDKTEVRTKNFGDRQIEEKNLNRFNTGQLLITMSTEKQEDFDQISDIENSKYGYDRINIYESMNRMSDKVHLINDGPDTMYVLLNRTGIDSDNNGIWTHQTEEELEKNWTTQDNLHASWSSNEIMIYPGEKWTFFDIYEMRVRSPTQGNKYRVTEDDVVGNTIRQVM